MEGDELRQEMDYGDYLQLERVLGAQRPLSPDHNEMLFIVQHQTTELWMKLALHELRAARAAIRTDSLPPAFKMLARVGRVFAQLIQAWDVLATLTPSEYRSFRAVLGHGSGLQSWQYREIEFILGNKNRAMLRAHQDRPEVRHALESALAEPSLYDEALRLLARRGFAIAPAVLERAADAPHAPDPSVEAAWIAIYRDTDRHFDLYELAEELVDLEDYFRQWRFRHVTTVQRVIGFKPGTGGTSGVGYLRQRLDVRLFPELWELRTAL